MAQDAIAMFDFFHGLLFFTIALAVLLESRRDSRLALGHQLRWLGGFALVLSVVEWVQLFHVFSDAGWLHDALTVTQTLLLPLGGILLIRFGIGLVQEAGPLPSWLNYMPIVLFVPGSLLVAYVFVVTLTASDIMETALTWSRTLLYTPGFLLAAYGFYRQARCLACNLSREPQAHYWLFAAAGAFAVRALIVVVAVLAVVVLEGQPGPILPLSVETVEWAKMIGTLLLVVTLIGALRVFEMEREQQIHRLESEREVMQQAALGAQSAAREDAERWIDALVSISRQIANLSPIDDVMAAVVQHARNLLRADIAAVGLWNEDRSLLDLKYYASEDGTFLVSARAIRNPVILRTIQLGRALRFPEDRRQIRTHWFCPALNRRMQTAVIVPLMLDNGTLGGLWVSRHTAAPFTEQDVIGLERMADQVVIALEHALMAGRLQSLAVVEERSRIAREMHDSVAQILGYLSLQTQTLEALVRQGDSDTVLAELRQAREMVRAAQADVRENILSLRTTLAGDMGLIAALDQYVQEFMVQTGINAQLASTVTGVPALSPLAETQLVRIVQEALTNVRKHACAHDVRVGLSMTGSCFQVVVSDDGVGFADTGPGRGHFGLQTMRERAESVGGSLVITSALNQGTQVTLRLPTVQ